MERCYSVSYGSIDNKKCILTASEAIEGRLSYYPINDLNDRHDIWDDVGGTMSIIQVPEQDGMFYVGTRFYPGFNAKEADVTCVYKEGSEWKRNTVVSLPYLHRFDLFKIGNKTVFVGCTLCTSKTDREDWSNPGKIYAGVLNADPIKPFQTRIIKEGLLKNHGYWRGIYRNKEAGYIACDDGIYVFLPEDFSLTKIFDGNISEMAVYDLDHDGNDEIVTIEPFHGNQMKVYKLIDGTYRNVFSFPYEIEFAHALWAGRFNEKDTIILGTRRLDKKLYMIVYENGNFNIETLDQDNGSANVCVIEHEGQQLIVSANNAIGEVAVYY